MRILVPTLLAAVLAAAAFAGDGKPAGRPAAPPPPPGVHWEADLEAGLARAALEGRPILFAVNVLETERANNRLATESYRSPAWGEATRGYVAFVCNPNEHAPGAGACTRYPGHTCAAHRAALDWFLKRFGLDLISPQHVILEPDGDVALRKEYYTGVVGPSLLDGYLSNLSPRIAYSRAGIGRERRMRDVVTAPLDDVAERMRAWLASDDGLVAAALVNVLDETQDEARRLALIAGLRHTPSLQAPVLALAAEDAILGPQDAPAETLQWLRTLFSVDRALAVWAASSALVRLPDESARDAVLRVWTGVGDGGKAPAIADVPAAERAAAYEALILAGDRRGRVSAPDATFTAGREAEVRRARRKMGLATPRASNLTTALTLGTPGVLREALVEAPPDEVQTWRAAVVELATSNEAAFRVRVAASLALLRTAQAGGERPTVIETLVRAVVDPIEGRAARELAIAILGQDPGQSLPEWRRALDDHLQKAGAR